MVAFLTDNALDLGLNYIYALSGANLGIYINYTQQPTTYTQATSTYACGNKTGAGVTCGAPTNGDSSGRKIVIAAVTDGSVTASQTAGWFSVVKTNATTELLAANNLSSTQAVTSGNQFTLTAITITIPDPTT